MYIYIYICTYAYIYIYEYTVYIYSFVYTCLCSLLTMAIFYDMVSVLLGLSLHDVGDGTLSHGLALAFGDPLPLTYKTVK